MIIFLARHGTTDWNREKKIQGQTDIPLDDTGKAMACLTGLALRKRHIHFDAVYSSPLSRAMETARLLTGSSPDAPIIQTDPRLKELNFGAYEGHTLEDCEQMPGSTFQYFMTRPEKYHPLGGGETLETLCARTRDFMQQVVEPLVQRGSLRTILITAHGAANKSLLMYLRGETDLAGFWGDGLQKNCSLTKIRAVPAKKGSAKNGSVNGTGPASAVSYEILGDEVLYTWDGVHKILSSTD